MWFPFCHSERSEESLLLFLSSPSLYLSSPRRRGPSIVGRVPQKPDTESNVGQDPCDPDILSKHGKESLRRGGFSLSLPPLLSAGGDKGGVATYCFILVISILILIGCHSDPISTSDAPQPTLVGGTISSDTTWRTKDGPYHIIENIFVPSGVTWEVEAGSEIIVEWNRSIEISGVAELNGANENHIDVRSNNGVWQGFLFQEQNHVNFDYIDIYNSIVAFRICNNPYAYITNCSFISCDSIGVEVDSASNVEIGDCEFVNDRALNLLEPKAIFSKYCRYVVIYNSQITGFHFGVHLQNNLNRTHIVSSVITRCDIGIVCDGQDTVGIGGNQFHGCQTGILITQGSPLIDYNTFDKQGECVRVDGFCQPEAHYNSFADPDQWAWVHYSPWDVDATYNWWGTTDPDSIDRLIYDHNDDPHSGTVIYEPFLTSAP